MENYITKCLLNCSTFNLKKRKWISTEKDKNIKNRKEKEKEEEKKEEMELEKGIIRENNNKLRDYQNYLIEKITRVEMEMKKLKDITKKIEEIKECLQLLKK